MDTWTKRSDTAIANLPQDSVCGVIFDYGGVLADEGFRKGCYAIATRYLLDEEEFFRAAVQAMYSSGYSCIADLEQRLGQRVDSL